MARSFPERRTIMECKLRMSLFSWRSRSWPSRLYWDSRAWSSVSWWKSWVTLSKRRNNSYHVLVGMEHFYTHIMVRRAQKERLTSINAFLCCSAPLSRANCSWRASVSRSFMIGRFSTRLHHAISLWRRFGAIDSPNHQPPGVLALSWERRIDAGQMKSEETDQQVPPTRWKWMEMRRIIKRRGASWALVESNVCWTELR